VMSTSNRTLPVTAVPRKAERVLLLQKQIFVSDKRAHPVRRNSYGGKTNPPSAFHQQDPSRAETAGPKDAIAKPRNVVVAVDSSEVRLNKKKKTKKNRLLFSNISSAPASHVP